MALVAASVGIAATWFAGIATATSPQAPFFWFAAGTIVYWFDRARRPVAGEQRPYGGGGVTFAQPHSR
jgi:hypothetical protein